MDRFGLYDRKKNSCYYKKESHPYYITSNELSRIAQSRTELNALNVLRGNSVSALPEQCVRSCRVGNAV